MHTKKNPGRPITGVRRFNVLMMKTFKSFGADNDNEFSNRQGDPVNRAFCNARCSKCGSRGLRQSACCL